MDKMLDDLAYGFSEDNAQLFDSVHADFEKDASVTDDEQERILSSVMRKAGLEMKEKITVKRTKKRKIGFVGLIAAAAILGIGVIGVIGHDSYTEGFMNGVRAMYPDWGVADKEYRNIARITEKWEGEIVENTFEGLEFEVDGVVNDSMDQWVILTVRRTDGQPFTAEEGENYYFKYAGGSIPTEGSELPHCIPMFGNAYTAVNDDGTLSVIMAHFGSSDTATEYKAQLIQLYKSDMTEEYYNNGFADEAAPTVVDTSSPPDYKPTEEHDAAYQEAIDSVASEIWDGSMIFTYKIDMKDKTVHILPEDNEYGYDITIGNMSVSAHADNLDFAGELAEGVICNEITIYISDGWGKLSDEWGICLQTTGIWNEGNAEIGSSEESMFSCNYEFPINCTKVTAIDINGKRIEIK